jgi:hypothetical protein
MTRRILVILISIAAMCGSAAAGEMPHVRDNGDARIAILLQEGIRRSATLRAIIAQVDASDGIVYIEEGRCRYSARACLSHSIVLAGPHRILRIHIDTARDRDDVIAVFGHELRHALEVLSQPQLRSMQAVMYFYETEGTRSDGRYETTAALTTESAVLRELSH